MRTTTFLFPLGHPHEIVRTFSFFLLVFFVPEDVLMSDVFCAFLTHKEILFFC